MNHRITAHHYIPTPPCCGQKMIHLPSAAGGYIVCGFSCDIQHHWASAASAWEGGGEENHQQVMSWDGVSLPLPLLRSNEACGTTNRLLAAELGWIWQCKSAAEVLSQGKIIWHFFIPSNHLLFIYILNNDLSCCNEFGKKIRFVFLVEMHLMHYHIIQYL